MKLTKEIVDKGTKHERTEWRNEKGILHREDGPAVIYEYGRKVWYKNGQHHREDGPAIEWNHGYKEWYIDHELYTEEDYKKEMYNRNLEKLNGS